MTLIQCCILHTFLVYSCFTFKRTYWFLICISKKYAHIYLSQSRIQSSSIYFWWWWSWSILKMSSSKNKRFYIVGWWLCVGFLYVDNYGYATTIELVVVVVLVTMTKLRTNRKKNLMKQLDNAYIHFACDLWLHMVGYNYPITRRWTRTTGSTAMPSPIENILFLTKSLTDQIWMLLNYNYVHQEINLKVESPIATHI